MGWTQHVLPCADAAAITGEDVHDNCTAILCEAQGEPDWADGGICWTSHGPADGQLDADGHPVPTAVERLNPGVAAEDWR